MQTTRDDLAIGYVECAECGHPIETHPKGCASQVDGCPCTETFTQADVRRLRRSAGLPVRWKPER